MKTVKSMLPLALLAVALLVTTGCEDEQNGRQISLAVERVESGEPWKMHTNADELRNADAMELRDVNVDGLEDILICWEKSCLVTIQFHPGADGFHERWPSVTIGYGGNPEEAGFADLDLDANVDVFTAQGQSPWSDWGSEPGIKVFWGPSEQEVHSSEAWVRGTAAVIPATWMRGQIIFAAAHQLDGQSAEDISVTGRILRNGTKTGLYWVQAPELQDSIPAGTDPRDNPNRDLPRWKVFDIDPDVYGLSYIDFADFDNDGDSDLIISDSDMQNPPGTRQLVWYEHPGIDSPQLCEHWTKHELITTDDIGDKAWPEVVDLNGDGHLDVLVQGKENIYYMCNSGEMPVSFETVVVPKPEDTVHRARHPRSGPQQRRSH